MTKSTIHIAINFEIASNDNFRAIILERDDEDSPYMVLDIIEVEPAQIKYLANEAQFRFDNHEVVVFAEKHIENTDFGRAKLFSSKAMKIIQQLKKG